MGHRTSSTVDRPNHAERITLIIGSWAFLGIQTTFLVVYVIINAGLAAWAYVSPWDPFPYVFLNLMLSFQAAYTGPVVLMAQNAQGRRDKKVMMALLHLAERGDKRDEDMTKIMESVLALNEGTQTLIEAMPVVVRQIVREELERVTEIRETSL